MRRGLRSAEYLEPETGDCGSPLPKGPRSACPKIGRLSLDRVVQGVLHSTPSLTGASYGVITVLEDAGG